MTSGRKDYNPAYENTSPQTTVWLGKITRGTRNDITIHW